MSNLLDDFDAASASTPPPIQAAPASILDAFDDAARSASAPPPPPAQPSTKTDRFLTGAGDLGYKAAQIMQRVIPQPVEDALNSFNQFLSKKTGAEYVPLNQVDQRVNQREDEYNASRAAAGSQGFDWMRLFGNAANPINYALPQAGAGSTIARVVSGALQGAGSSVLSTPTTGDDQKRFWESQGRLGAFGALGGGAGTVAAEAAAPLVNKGLNSLRSLLNVGGKNATADAETLAAQTLKDKGINPADMQPGVLNWFKGQVADSLKAGQTPTPQTLSNVAEAASLPVPIPLLRGQASRDPMQFAKEQNLRGITGVGEPITQILGDQNKAFIANLDAMGAKNAPNVVDAGRTAIDAINKLDEQARNNVTAAYTAFKNSTGKDLDVPLQGLAQDYARVSHDFGMDNIPQGVRNHLNELGLLSGTQKRVFTIEDAEGLLKVINKNYDPKNKVSSSALDELRRSVQGAITDGAGGDAVGAEAAQLAAAARGMAKKRFDLMDAIPAYRAAVSGAEPDKFIQKHFWNGNVSEIAGLKGLLSMDPQALASVKSSIMGDLKQTALNDRSAERGIFSEAQFNRTIRDQNNAKRLQALFEPKEVQGLNSLGNVAEVALLAPKAAAVNTSNTAGAAANLVQGAVKGGLGTQALSHVGGMDIPIASWAARLGAQKSGEKTLSSLVRNATQPLSAADIDALGFLTKRSGTVGGVAASNSQK